MAEQQQQLIWFGAGTAKQPLLDFAAYSQVTLVEARESACQLLLAAFPNSNVTVLQQLVTAEPGNYIFNSYNLGEFSAISALSGLKKLFPGLKSQGQEQLQSVAVSSLIQQLITDKQLAGTHNTLVIDIPDQAMALLHQLTQAELLGMFNTLYIQYGATELYQGMLPFSELGALLAEHFFTLQHCDNADPDLPIYTFKLDCAAKEIALLNRKVKKLNEQLAKVEQDNKIAIEQAINEKQQLQQHKTALAEQLNACKQQVDTLAQQFEQQAIVLTQQLDVSKQQAAADKQQLEQQKVELSKQLETAKQQAAAEKQQLEQQKAELSKQLESAQQQAAADKQQLEQQKAELSKQLEATKQHASTEKQQLDQQKAELAKQLESAEQQAATDKQQLEQQKAELSKQLETAKQQAAAEKQQLEQQKAELSKQLDAGKQLFEKLQKELEQVQKHAANRLEKIAELEKTNRLLNETNNQLNKRQQALEQEMLKAQAQIEIIKDLLLKQS